MQERGLSRAALASFWLGLAAAVLGPLLMAVMFRFGGESVTIDGGAQAWAALASYYCAPIVAIVALAVGIPELAKGGGRLLPAIGVGLSVLVEVFTVLLWSGCLAR